MEYFLFLALSLFLGAHVERLFATCGVSENYSDHTLVTEDYSVHNIERLCSPCGVSEDYSDYVSEFTSFKLPTKRVPITSKTFPLLTVFGT